ncbi:MAG: M2 family metallopeptidase [Xanthomonadales bacterium]|nr:M2 family metallopeptidase [Xanthomonadales bacterium]
MTTKKLAWAASLAAAFLSIGLTACTPDTDIVPSSKAPPTAAEAAEFAAAAESTLMDLATRAERAAWVRSNYITDDTQAIAAEANGLLTAAAVDLAGKAARYDDLALDDDVRRKLNRLKLAMTLPAPPDPAKIADLARISGSLESTYGTGSYCLSRSDYGGTASDQDCLDLTGMTQIMASSRDPELLRELWTGWRTVSPTMRAEFQRLVDLGNEGAQTLGYDDLGSLWRSGYDMPADDFAAEMDRLWGQVKPLYDALHCHVRDGLAAHYGEALVPEGQPIPAHLLGNMWAQTWGNVYDLVAPADADPGYDLTERIVASGMTEIDMVLSAEGFFTSMGFDPLPDGFWRRSLFTKPRDRDVVCHASAWNLDQVDDLRIKMCIQPSAEDFVTIHHELGHNIYQRAYNQQPFMYRNGANDGFHEAIGDTIALSVTPVYLKTIGLIDDIPDESSDLGLLLSQALDKIAFLPFGLLVDRWRWQVFSGETPPQQYNQAWWELRRQYQGVAAPVYRSEADFDPGAKYHVPANVPYTRYFLAGILQFQFHRSLCEIAGFEGSLHRCSVYGNRQAGKRLNEMLAMGASRPWPEALEALTGSREIDAGAIIDYFAPLMDWLDEQNQGRNCGW